MPSIACTACTIESGTLAIPSTAGAEEPGVGGGGGWKLTAATAAAAATIKNNEDDELFEQMANDAIIHGDDGVLGNNPPSVVITVECRCMIPGTTVRIPPMERTHRGWHADHFHSRLRSPDNTTTGVGRAGMIVLLQARSSECLAVALSPAHDYELGKTYVVHFGADGNTRTVLRRHLNYNECVESSYSSRACSEVTWISYWICLRGGMLSAGIGSTPGLYCIGTLDDTMYDALRSGVDAVRYVGIGNSALRRNARDVRVRNVIVCGIPSHFGLVGVPINSHDDGTLINVDSLFGGEKILIDNNSGMPTDEELLAEYDKERLKAKARAAKFGIEYTEPAAEAFLKWSECRRLRANPEKGFITGIDTFSIEELAKADARRLRFAKPGEEKTKKKKRKGGGDEDGEEGGDDDDDEGDENRNDDESDDEAMNDDDNKDDVAEWEKTKQDPLPIEQAWENWKLVKHFRIDPPQSLLLPDLTTPTNTPVVTVIPTKIHVFAIDWACFKQIRTDDIMSYFKDYGPSYVEWLGELSCNVHFEDRHTAARAFRALSRELPTPPPKCISSVMETGAVLSVDNTIKGWARDADGNFILDELGRRTFASEDVVGDGVPMGDGDVVDVTITENGDVKEKMEILPDFASMGWRFCKWTVRKVSNDRYGKRGTRARVLMRLATSIDILDDRPTEWPKPPPGFTTKRVLMPWHDFSGKRRGGGGSGTGGRRGENNKRRKRGSEGKGGRRSNGGGQRDVPVEERMSTGLRAGR